MTGFGKGARWPRAIPPQEVGVCPKGKARVPRPHPNPLPQERGLSAAGPGGPGDLAEGPIKVNQTESRPIKANQACGGGGDGCEWTVDSG